MRTDLFKYDESKITDTQVKKIRDENDFSVSEISIPTYANAFLTAYYLRPKLNSKFPCILYSHWLANKQDANKTEFLAEAERLCKDGFACLLVDTVFANWPKARMKWKGNDYAYDKQLVALQVKELRLLLLWLRDQPEIDTHRIALVGHDFGAMFNAVVAGIDKDIKACIMMAAVPDFSDWFTMRKKMSDDELEKYRINMLDVAPIKYLEIAHYTSFLFQFGKKDKSFVPKEKAEMLFEKTSGEKEMQWYDENHAIHLNDIATNYRISWLKKQLGINGG